MQRIAKVTVPASLGPLTIDTPADADIFKIVGSGPDIIMWYTTDPDIMVGAMHDTEERRIRRFHIAVEGETLPTEMYEGLRKRYMDSIVVKAPIAMCAADQTVVRHVWEIDPPAVQEDLGLELIRAREQIAELLTIARGASEIRKELFARVTALEIVAGIEDTVEPAEVIEGGS